MTKAEQVTGAFAEHGEGPFWDAAGGRLEARLPAAGLGILRRYYPDAACDRCLVTGNEDGWEA